MLKPNIDSKVPVLVAPLRAKFENLRSETEHILALVRDLSQREVPGAYDLVESMKYDWKRILFNLRSLQKNQKANPRRNLAKKMKSDLKITGKM